MGRLPSSKPMLAPLVSGRELRGGPAICVMGNPCLVAEPVLAVLIVCCYILFY